MIMSSINKDYFLIQIYILFISFCWCFILIRTFIVISNKSSKGMWVVGKLQYFSIKENVRYKFL